jgi:hypothetical protein
MVMREPGLCTIRIQELTTTIQDTITHIRDIDIFTISMEIGAINFTRAVTIGIHGFPIMSTSASTMGLNACMKGGIKG